MTMPVYDLILRQGRLRQSDHLINAVDIALRDGKIAAIAPHVEGVADLELDAHDLFVSPPFVESHIHLDSAMTAGDPRWNQSGTLFEGIGDLARL